MVPFSCNLRLQSLSLVLVVFFKHNVSQRPLFLGCASAHKERKKEGQGRKHSRRSLSLSRPAKFMTPILSPSNIKKVETEKCAGMLIFCVSG